MIKTSKEMEEYMAGFKAGVELASRAVETYVKELPTIAGGAVTEFRDINKEKEKDV